MEDKKEGMEEWGEKKINPCDSVEQWESSYRAQPTVFAHLIQQSDVYILT